MFKISENTYTKEFAYLIGALLGDGNLYISLKYGCYQFSIASEDKDFCEICQDITENFFGKKGKITPIKRGERISYYQFRICSKEIIYYLKDLTNNRKKIPFFIYLNNEFKKEFIRGLVDADGWISKVNASDGYIRYRVGFKNISIWTEEFRKILKSLEVKVGRMREVFNDRSVKKAYTFSINTYDYCTKIGFGINRKRELQKEFLEFYKNKGNRDRYKNREIYKHRGRYKIYKILKKCPICNKKYNEHWKVVNHIRKTHNEEHQIFLKQQEDEVYRLFMENTGKVEELADKLYLNKNIFCGISYMRIEDILEKYIDRIELKKIKNKRISRTMKTIPKTAEHNKNVSIAVKKAWDNGTFNTEEYKEAKRLGYLKRRSFAGKNNPMYNVECPKGAGYGKGGKRKDLNNQYFRSTWEANICRILELKKRDYIYEPERFYIIINGKEYSYLPDFYFSDKNFYYEVKGHAKSSSDWSCSCKCCIINREKIKETIKKYNIKIFIIGNYEYKRFVRIFKQLIPKWEE